MRSASVFASIDKRSVDDALDELGTMNTCLVSVYGECQLSLKGYPRVVL